MRISIVVGIGCVLACGTARADDLRVVDEYKVIHTGDVITRWVPTLDGIPLSREAFYHLTGNDQITIENHRRHVVGGFALGGSMVALGLSTYELISLGQEHVTNFGEPVDKQQHGNHGTIAAISGATSLFLMIYGTYELSTTAGSMESPAAHVAASRYNASHVAPYATPDGGGVMMQGQF